MSFNIALSGLRSVNQELSVISNNIANSSTAGFKSSRAEFAAIYAGGQGGGVEMSTASQNFDKNGDTIATGRGLDLAISGAGFFVLKNANGQTSYTRAGMFQSDKDNYLVASDGARLQGYGINGAGELQNGVVGDLQVTASSIAAKASTKLEMGANLKADAEVPTTAPFDMDDSKSYNYSQSSKVYDSLGVQHTVTQYYVKTGENQWAVHSSVDGAAATKMTDLTFDTKGQLIVPADSKASLSFAATGADAVNLEIDLSKMSQYASEFSTNRNQADGYTSGDLTGVRVDKDGGVYAMFTNGQSLIQGQLIMANFANPNGLLQANNTRWEQSFSSGQPTIGTPGSGVLGSLSAGAYEGSNVDLTGELVNLMGAQRNYQANAKTISSSSEMTKILFNSF